MRSARRPWKSPGLPGLRGLSSSKAFKALLALKRALATSEDRAIRRWCSGAE